jgi:U-box domain
MDIIAPEHFVCPISMVVMTHPIRTETGQVFERRAILEWTYFGKATCPMSRKPLHPSRFVRDTGLEQEIKQWRLTNNIPAADEEEDDSEEFTFVPESAKKNICIKMDHILGLREKVLKNRDRRIASFRQQHVLRA